MMPLLKRSTDVLVEKMRKVAESEESVDVYRCAVLAIIFRYACVVYIMLCKLRCIGICNCLNPRICHYVSLSGWQLHNRVSRGGIYSLTFVYIGPIQ